MRSSQRFLGCLAIFLLGGTAAYAQAVISAKSGLIHYASGKVLIDGKIVETSRGSFPQVKENSVLETQEGLAEVLLNPGVFLRLGENSSFRMITNRLIDTRLDFLSGSAVVEADEVAKDTNVTIVYKNATVQIAKKGLYHFDAQPAMLKVFDGEAVVQADGRTTEVKEGRELAFDGLLVSKFDKDETDALDRWSRRRGEYIAMANVSAAKSLHDYGYGGNWLGGWYFNPYYGMFTYVPVSGLFYSPYGYQFWSPVSVRRVFYQPRPYYNGGGGGFYNAARGYNTVNATPRGYSGAIAATAPRVSGSPAASAPSAPSAPVSRGGGGGGPRH